MYLESCVVVVGQIKREIVNTKQEG